MKWNSIKNIQVFIFLILLSCTIMVSCNSSSDEETTAAHDHQKVETKEVDLNYPDSSVYWVNKKYIECLSNGQPACDCMTENEFLIVWLDEEKGKILIQSTVKYFEPKNSDEFDLVTDSVLNKYYLVKKQSQLKTSIIVKKSDKLELLYNGNILTFEKQTLKTAYIPSLHNGSFEYSSDIWDQRNKMNARSFQYYSYTDSTKVFYTSDEISQLIDENRLSISFDNDMHSNVMLVKGQPNKYFHVEYQGDSLILYDKTQKWKTSEPIDLSLLERQVFHKDEQKN